MINCNYCWSLILPSLVHQVRDAKIKVLGTLKQESDEECLEWKELAASLKVSEENLSEVLDSCLSLHLFIS